MQAFREIDGIDNIAVDGEFVRLSVNECCADSGVLLTANEIHKMIARLEDCAIEIQEQAERERLQGVLAQRLKIASLLELRNVRALLDGELPDTYR